MIETGPRRRHPSPRGGGTSDGGLAQISGGSFSGLQLVALFLGFVGVPCIAAMRRLASIVALWTSSAAAQRARARSMRLRPSKPREISFP